MNTITFLTTENGHVFDQRQIVQVGDKSALEWLAQGHTQQYSVWDCKIHNL